MDGKSDCSRNADKKVSCEHLLLEHLFSFESVSDTLTVWPLIEDEVLFRFSELFRDWKMGY